MSLDIGRRQFLVSTGSLAVAVTIGASALEALLQPAGAASGSGYGVRDTNEVFAYLCIGDDNRLTILSGKVELGTGVQTALTQIILEQLPTGLDQVDYVQGDTVVTPNGGYTAGSNTIRFESPRMRLAAATARAHLLDLAHIAFGGSRTALRIHDGSVSLGNSPNKSKTWAELLAGENTVIELDEAAPVVAANKHQLIGTSMPRVELPDKLLNRFKYVQDVAVPGMKHARVVRPSGRNSHYASHNDASLPSGVQAVRVGDLVAVIADDEWDAIRSTRPPLFSVQWTAGEPLEPQADLQTVLRDASLIYGVSDNDDGSFDAALASAEQVLSADYFTPFQMHGSFAPACAVADVRGVADATGIKATVWSSTQGVYQLRDAIAELIGLSEGEVRVVYVEASGCYGHMGADDAAGDAAVLSAQIGAPVRVQWMRQDEHQWEPLGAAMSHAMRGGVKSGRVVAWEHTVWSPPHSSRPGGNPGNLLAGQAQGRLPSRLPSQTGNAAGRNSQVTYAFPADRLLGYVVRNFDTDPSDPSGRNPASPLVWRLPRTTALRTLGGFSNCFANESFFDEIADAARLDPVKARLDYLPDPRAKAVVAAVAKAAKWNPSKPAPAPVGSIRTGRGVGFNQYETNDSYVAAIVDVEVDISTGEIRVVRAWVSHDCGQIINPDGLRAQIEGNLIQGISRTLVEEVEYLDDYVTTKVWQTAPPFNPGPQYDVIRYDQVPDIKIVLIDRPGEPPYGAGEPTIGCLPGAIGNAVFDATGARIRTLPMDPDRVLAALALT